MYYLLHPVTNICEKNQTKVDVSCSHKSTLFDFFFFLLIFDYMALILNERIIN